MVRKPLITQGYSLAEEVANSISHGIGLVFGIVGLVLLLVQAVDSNASATAITSYSLYGGSMIMLFLASTLYHAIPHQRAKLWLKKFDHCAIYLLIAGTYTPFTLLGLRGTWGWSLFAAIWILAVAGVVFKLFHTGRFPRLSTALYVAMGWLVVVAIKPMLASIDAWTLGWLLAGGVFYTLGTYFYHRESIPYAHAIWHLFVIAGSVCHFVAVAAQVV